MAKTSATLAGKHCGDALFCRDWWHGEQDDDARHPWLRNMPNPMLLGMGAMVFTDSTILQTAFSSGGALVRSGLSAGATAIRGAAASSSAAFGAAATAVGEASPVVIAGGAVAAVAAAGVAATYVASQHSDTHALHLQNAIRNRARRCPVQPWSKSVGQLWETLQWYLAPQKESTPHVYHGSLWRNHARAEHLLRIQALCAPCPFDQTLAPSERLWADLLFCYSLWLEYNPHTANWGTCTSYGSPPMHFCWHNRWREDLRHAISDLARSLLIAPEFEELRNGQEFARALCLLGTLDHVLSWDVTTPEHGCSDLINAHWHTYRSFCKNLKERFAEAWAATLAPPEAEVNLEGFESHVRTMAGRHVPEGFRNLW